MFKLVSSQPKLKVFVADFKFVVSNISNYFDMIKNFTEVVTLADFGGFFLLSSLYVVHIKIFV